jgi:ATP-dependent Clp protease ATP-binding subunit ClpA
LELQLARLKQTLSSEQGITVEVSSQTKNRLITEGFDQTYGGRALSRAIQTLVEEPLAEKILQQEVKRGESVTV